MIDLTTVQLIIAACVTALVALIVGIVTAFLTFKSNSLARKNDHKLAVLKVLLEAAYKEYEFRTKQELEQAKAEGNTIKIKSFTEYIIFYRELAELFSNTTVTPEDLISSLKKNKTLIDTYYISREHYRPAYHKKVD